MSPFVATIPQLDVQYLSNFLYRGQGQAMVYNSILEAMGNTPMIRLNHINPPTNAEVLVKFEGLNVGGSIKTRTAYQMILAAEKAGIVGPGSIIVEPTSGNQGIGLALTSVYLFLSSSSTRTTSLRRRLQQQRRSWSRSMVRSTDSAQASERAAPSPA